MTDRRSLIAIVDDDSRLLESLSDLLESAGYTVRTFQSANSLLAHGLAGIDLLVTDIGMPGMDGFELRDRVMEARPGLPVFMITGRHELVELDRAWGVEMIFRKPFNASALLAAVANALSGQNVEVRT